MSNLRAMILTVALEDLDCKEVTPNNADFIRKYWKDTQDPDGYANRYPYCAAYCSYCVNEAQRRWNLFKWTKAPKFEAVIQWRDWAQDEGCIFTVKDKNPEVGDLFNLLPGTSHMGIVLDFDGINIHTIEANTDQDGTREGDGVWQKERHVNTVGDFIRIPTLSDSVQDL